MKTAIKTSALFLGLALLSTGVFASEKPTTAAAPAANNVVLFTSLSSGLGVQVIVHKAAPSASSVKIYDAQNNLIINDVLSKKDVVSNKGYDLSQLEYGSYTFQVTSNNVVTKRIVHIYNDENNQKSFFFEL